MTHEERKALLNFAKEIRNNYFPLPSKEEVQRQNEFIRKVCYATWSRIGHSAKISTVNSGLTLKKERDFEQEWMKHSEALCAYIEHQAKDEYVKAMKNCWNHRFKFNGQIAQVIFHSNLSLLDAMQEIYNIANEIKEMD